MTTAALNRQIIVLWFIRAWSLATPSSNRAAHLNGSRLALQFNAVLPPPRSLNCREFCCIALEICEKGRVFATFAAWLDPYAIKGIRFG